jgi:hypothetical protein
MSNLSCLRTNLKTSKPCTGHKPSDGIFLSTESTTKIISINAKKIINVKFWDLFHFYWWKNVSEKLPIISLPPSSQYPDIYEK